MKSCHHYNLEKKLKRNGPFLILISSCKNGTGHHDRKRTNHLCSAGGGGGGLLGNFLRNMRRWPLGTPKTQHGTEEGLPRPASF